jgi:hypothetical protein
VARACATCPDTRTGVGRILGSARKSPSLLKRGDRQPRRVNPRTRGSIRGLST